jgi:hypothetical protein
LWWRDARLICTGLPQQVLCFDALRSLCFLPDIGHDIRCDRTAGGEVVRHIHHDVAERTTTMTNEDRLAHHLISDFDTRSMGSFGRDDLQAFLDRKGQTLSFSVVNHLRWDLKQIFDMAVAE